MLELKNIKKTYKIGDIETKALDGINVAFREKEFVAILGTSGSGKTTCLNIIGGLDRYDEGDLIIKGKKTKDFTDKDWDAYRNNSIGFVFQSYNLISHLSIVTNVEMGMTLSGVSKTEKRKKALEVLEKVGLKDHLHKKPNQLSGGQMQRVAIARALANDPEILLCDEPTGALDTATGEHIMNLIKEIAKDKLVIMVTHNPEIADKYADRTVRFQDGKIIDDTNPHIERPKEDQFKLKKTSMSFLTALGLSFNNIKTKKGRTFLTAFASSIGIIGIAVILSLSTGFQTQIDNFQSDAMSEFPIMINQQAMELNTENMQTMIERTGNTKLEEYSNVENVYLHDPSKNKIVHNNILTKDFIDYVNKIDPNICSSVGYVRLANMNLLRKVNDKIIPVSFSSTLMGGNSSNVGIMTPMTSMQNAGLSSYPTMLDKTNGSYLEKNYDLLAGAYPTNQTELVLVVDTKNRINIETLSSLGFETENIESINFNDILNTEFKVIDNNDFYIKTEFDTYMPNSNFDEMYDLNKNITLKITGIVRQNPNTSLALLSPGIAYSDELSEMIIDKATNSDIVIAQKLADYNVMTKESLTKETKENFISYLGGSGVPVMMMIYPNGFDEKDEVISYLDKYNENKSQENKIIYTDLASTISSMTGGIMNGITIVLIAFAGISLVVSLIMIGIITYISVLERTREIGILKALGARKKDITRVFDAETFILGAFSGILGIIIAMLLTIPINIVIYNVSELSNVAQLQISHAVILVIVSTILTMLGGHIPAKFASNKDAVEALRSE